MVISALGSNICGGDSLVSLTAVASSGVPPYSYLWSNGETGMTIQNLPIGNYEVTVTDSSNGWGMQFTTIPGSLPVIPSEVINHIDTMAGTGGSISLSVSGGTPPYSYLWSNSATNANIYSLGAGQYSLTITDIQACTYDFDYIIGYYNSNQSLTIVDSILNNPCFGDNQGAIYLSISGGVTPYSIHWSNGDTVPFRYSLYSSNYAVTVHDANYSPPSSTMPWTYASTGFSHTVTIPANSILLDGNPISTGDYIGLFHNDNGLFKCAGYVEYLGAGLNITAIGDDPGTSTKEGFFSGELFNWRVWDSSTGNQHLLMASYDSAYASTDHFSNTSASGISLMMGNSMLDFGNQVIDTFQVTSPTYISAYQSGSNYAGYGVSHINATDGYINCTVSGGTTPYSFVWSNGETTEDIANLYSGTYQLTITDAHGCTTTLGRTLTAPYSPFELATSTAPESCSGNCDGTITLTPSGAFTPYAYQWSNGASTSQISNLCAGTYTVTVTAENTQAYPGLSWPTTVTAQSHTIYIPDTCLNAINLENLSRIGAFYLNNGIYSCSEYSIWSPGMGGISITAYADDPLTPDKDGFDIGEEIVWMARYGTSDVLKVLSLSYGSGQPNMGSFAVNGMSEISMFSLMNFEITQSITVDMASPILINETITMVDPIAGTLGAISTAPSGGQSPYAYLWNTGATSSSISNLSSGQYSLTVTDILNCFAVDSFLIDSLGSFLSFDLLISEPTCNGANDGSVTVTNLIGQGPFTYHWSTGAVTNYIDGLSPGNYSITITDYYGATATNSIALTEPDSLMLTLNSTGVDPAVGNNGQIEAIVSGGATPYFYQWSTGDTSNPLTGLSIGTYQLTLTDSYACSATAATSIDFSVLPPWTLSFSGNCHSIDIPASALLEIDGTPIEPNDFIGAFYNNNGNYQCGGYVVWSSAGSTLLAYEDDTATYILDGFLTGNEFQWKFWDASTNTEHYAAAIYNATYPDQQYFAVGGSSAVYSIQSIGISATIYGTISIPTKTFLPTGIMLLYQQTPSGFMVISKTPVYNGYYIFTGIQAGDYLLYAIPKPGQEFGIPAYFGNQTDWQDGNWVTVINNSSIANIVLDPVIPYNTGTATIEGIILQGSDASYNPAVFDDDWFPQTKAFGDPARNIAILLYDDQMNPMDFRLTNDQGNFEFSQLEYGSYFVKVEKAGLQSDSVLVVLDASNPIVSDLVFHLNQGQILSNENIIADFDMRIFPNPVSDELQIILPGNSENISIELFSITGQKQDLQGFQNLEGLKKHTLDVSNIQSGVYMLKITVGDTIFVEKITKL